MLRKNNQLNEAASEPLFLYPKTGREMYDYVQQFDEEHAQLIKNDVSTIAFLQMRAGKLQEPDYLADIQPKIEELVTINLDKRMVATSGYYAWQVMNGYEQYDLLIGGNGETHAVYCLKNEQNAVLVRQDITDETVHQNIQRGIESIIESDVFCDVVDRQKTVYAYHTIVAASLAQYVNRHKTLMEGKSKLEKEYDAHVDMIRRSLFRVATGDSVRYKQPLVQPRDWRPAPIYASK